MCRVEKLKDNFIPRLFWVAHMFLVVAVVCKKALGSNCCWGFSSAGDASAFFSLKLKIITEIKSGMRNQKCIESGKIFPWGKEPPLYTWKRDVKGLFLLLEQFFLLNLFYTFLKFFQSFSKAFPCFQRLSRKLQGKNKRT